MNLSEIIPPHNLEMEKGVLASCLLVDNAIDVVMNEAQEDYFYDRKNKVIYSVLNEVFSKGYNPNHELILKDARMEGYEAYIAELFTTKTWTPENIEIAVKRLANKAKERKCLMAAIKAIGVINSDNGNHEEKAEMVSSAIDAISDSIVASSGLSHVKDYIPAAYRQLKDAMDGKGLGVSTGISKFDEATGGLHRGEYTIISGRPSDGKTTYAMAMAINMAKQGESVGIFSLEMQGSKITNRLACSVGDGLIRNGHFRGVETPKKEHLKSYQESLNKLHNLNIYIDDTPKTTNLSITNSLRSFVKKGKLSVVIIDHFSLIGYAGENKQGKAYERKEEITRGIQRILKELNLIGIILVQLGRDAQNRRPRLSDLSDTKALEQDANNVLMIWNPIHGDRGRRVLCCEKARDGGGGDYYTNFHGDTCKTESMLETQQESYLNEFSGKRTIGSKEESWNGKF